MMIEYAPNQWIVAKSQRCSSSILTNNLKNNILKRPKTKCSLFFFKKCRRILKTMFICLTEAFINKRKNFIKIAEDCNYLSDCEKRKEMD